MEKKPLSFFTAGLIITIVMILLGLVFYLTEIYKTQQWLSYISYVLLLVMIIVAVMNYAKSKDGLVTFGECFGWGFKMSMIITVLYLVYLAAFILIFPDFKEQMLQITREGMEKKNRPEDEIDAGMSMMNKSFYIFMFIGTIFFFLVIGVIGSLLGGAFAKKKPVTRF